MTIRFNRRDLFQSGSLLAFLGFGSGSAAKAELQIGSNLFESI
jgi:hypothetical protein